MDQSNRQYLNITKLQKHLANNQIAQENEHTNMKCDSEHQRYEVEKRRVENGLKQLLEIEYDESAEFPYGMTAKSDQMKQAGSLSNTSRSFLHFKPPLSTKAGQNTGGANTQNDSKCYQNDYKGNIQVQQGQLYSSGNQSLSMVRLERKHSRQNSLGAISDLNCTRTSNSSSSRLSKKQSYSQLETIEQLKQKKSTEYLYHKMGLNSPTGQEMLKQKIMKHQPIERERAAFFVNDNNCGYNDFLNYKDSEEDSSTNSSRFQTNNKLNIANYDMRSASYTNDNDDDHEEKQQISLNFTLSDAKSQFLFLSNNKKQQQLIQEQIQNRQHLFATKIQKNVRRFIQQRRYHKLINAVLLIQSQFKKYRKIKEKKIKDHLFVLSGQQKRVLKEVERLVQIETSINELYKHNKRVQKYLKKHQQKLFEQFTNYNKQKEVATIYSSSSSSSQTTTILSQNIESQLNDINYEILSLKNYQVPTQLVTSLQTKIKEIVDSQYIQNSQLNSDNSLIQKNFMVSENEAKSEQMQQLRMALKNIDIQSIKKGEYNKTSSTTLHPSKTSANLTPNNSASNKQGYLTTQESENYTERLNENCRCSAQKIIQKLRDELKQKLEHDSQKQTNINMEFLFIQDELHKSNIQHKSLMLQISEALKKFEIKIITDLSTSNQQNFELIKDLQQINTFIQEQIMFCSPQIVKRRQLYQAQSSNESSSGISSKTIQHQKPFESRKLIFDSAGSFCTN